MKFTAQQQPETLTLTRSQTCDLYVSRIKVKRDAAIISVQHLSRSLFSAGEYLPFSWRIIMSVIEHEWPSWQCSRPCWQNVFSPSSPSCCAISTHANYSISILDFAISHQLVLGSFFYVVLKKNIPRINAPVWHKHPSCTQGHEDNG